MTQANKFHLIESLTRAPCTEEREHLFALIAELDTLQSHLDLQTGFDPTQIQKLQVARTFSSATLSDSQPALEAWDAGQRLIEAWIEEDKQISLNDLIHLNQLLTGDTSGLRTVPIYTGNGSYPRPEELHELLDYFITTVLANSDIHPLLFASQARQWLVSIHPFNNANGRTSQLLADLFLLKAGYLPLTFTSKLDTLVASLSVNSIALTPYIATIKFLNCVKHSYYILRAI